uniref:Uncharacterized protein n=1 Tax=Aegilops tauschii subsp. strangulata TaxID=200361 RepID=A0A453LY55_AEGTS
MEKKRFKFLLSNGQHPTNQIQGGRNRRGQNNHDIKPYSSLKPRGRTNSPGRHGAVRFAVPARKRCCVCAQSLRRYAYRQSSSRHPRSCGSQPGGGFCGDARVAVSVLLLPDVYGTQPSQVHAAVVTWSSWQRPDSDAAHRGLPGATGRWIVSPELSCLPQLVKCRIPWNLLLTCCYLGAFFWMKMTRFDRVFEQNNLSLLVLCRCFPEICTVCHLHASW